MVTVSVVIPARNERFLNKTVHDVLHKSRGAIEIIVILDGYWPSDPVPEDPRVRIAHFGTSFGMRHAINTGVALSSGKYIMKLDAHCMLDKGFDEKLVADCEKNWVVIPRRHRLEPETWTLQQLEKPPVDYEYLSFPNNYSDYGGAGLHGRQWNRRTIDRMDKPEYLIDDQMSFQGSCWFMHKDYFYELELMDNQNYGEFAHEAQEIGLKCWLSGGRVIVNKKTWYAHLHKGKIYGRGYALSNLELRKGTAFTNKWITNEAWSKQTRPFKWLLDKFSPIPGWPQI